MLNEKTSGKTQKEVIENIAKRTGLPVSKVKEVMDEQAKMASAELIAAEVFILPGIGKLKASQNAERIGRNPKTGDEVVIPAKRRIRVTLNKNFKAVVK